MLKQTVSSEWNSIKGIFSVWTIPQFVAEPVRGDSDCFPSQFFSGLSLCSSISWQRTSTKAHHGTAPRREVVKWARRPCSESDHIRRGWPGERAAADTLSSHYQSQLEGRALEQHHGSMTSSPYKIYPRAPDCVVLIRGSGDKFPTISVRKLFGSNGLQQRFIYGALTRHADPLFAALAKQLFPTSRYIMAGSTSGERYDPPRGPSAAFSSWNSNRGKLRTT